MQTGPTILLVEDDLDLRESLQMLLVSEGYEVASAGDGLEAIEILTSMNPLPGLILLDWMMPRMDGEGFCRALDKLEPRFQEIPVVLLTANGKVQEKVELVGADYGLAKPVDIDVLLDTIQCFVRVTPERPAPTSV